jgi:hypothetical protein
VRSSEALLRSRRDLLRLGLTGSGLAAAGYLGRALFVVPAFAQNERFFPPGTQRESHAVGHCESDSTQMYVEAFGWTVVVRESAPVRYSIRSTNVSEFSDPSIPGDHNPRPVRVVRAKPQHCGATRREWRVLDQWDLPREENHLLSSHLGVDNEDQFFATFMKIGNAWPAYNASPASGLSNVQWIDSGNAIRITFGGTQPISIEIRGHDL